MPGLDRAVQAGPQQMGELRAGAELNNLGNKPEKCGRALSARRSERRQRQERGTS